MKPEIKLEWADPARLKLNIYNPRKISEEDFAALIRSLKEFGFVDPVVVRRANSGIIGGHQRVKAALQLGHKKVPVIRLPISEEKARLLNVALNRIQGEWDFVLLKELLEGLEKEKLDLSLTGFSEQELQRILEGLDGSGKSGGSRKLAEKFIVPPLSILDARQGYWQERKAAWLSLGIRSELGRPENLLKYSQTILATEARRKWKQKLGSQASPSFQYGGLGTSVFDPVLCELIYRWYTPKKGRVLDPFAGGSVRGVVATYLGLRYLGLELRKEQIEANQQQAERLKLKPEWREQDAASLGEALKGEPFDLLFSCPPYFDLERYSEDPRDLSNLKTYEDFRQVYASVISQAVSLLRENRFACFVVSEIREQRRGFCRGFLRDTISAFEGAGAPLYNEAVLVMPVGSTAIRIDKQFSSYRKLGRVHQSVLTFFKGDPRKIPAVLGKLRLKAVALRIEEATSEAVAKGLPA